MSAARLGKVPTARRAPPAKESSARLDNKFRSGVIDETCLSLVDPFWLVCESKIMSCANEALLSAETWDESGHEKAYPNCPSGDR